MNSYDVITYISSLEAENERLTKEIEAVRRTTVDATRYYGVVLTTGEVAKLHGVSRSRIEEYAKKKILPLHPDSTDARFLFRASDVLTWDFIKLKRDYLDRKMKEKYTTR